MAGADTPMMQQWRAAKERHPDAIIFMRVGDFYELYFSDATDCAELIGITLTNRNNGGAADVPMAGVPMKAGAEYLQRLVRLGRRVAILEQVEDPALAKGLVKREVTEVITPGAITSEQLLSDARNNYLVSIAPGVDGRWGIAAADISTGETLLVAVGAEQLASELERLEPSEILLAKEQEIPGFPAQGGPSLTRRPGWIFDPTAAAEEVRRHYRVRSLDGFGIGSEDQALSSAFGALVSYVKDIQPAAADGLRPPRIERPSEAMPLDAMTRRNLELVEPLRADLAARTGSDGTLLSVIDQTRTPMGARLLRRWLLRPLTDMKRIGRRQDAVEALVEDASLRESLRDSLRQVRDLERLASRVHSGRGTPRDVRSIGDSLERVPAVKELLSASGSAPLMQLGESIDPLQGVKEAVHAALTDQPPLLLSDGDVIRPGYDEQLDDLRQVRDGAVDYIAQLQAREKERTGLDKGLKVGHNQNFGYYIEVSRSNLDKVPEDYIRRQTLTNAERYVTPELKEWEEKVTGAAEKIELREAELFTALRDQLAGRASELQALGEKLGALDVFAGLAELAVRSVYVRPELHEGFDLEIEGGRHPVVETMMPRDQFIPNDAALTEDGFVALVTGANMGGKSTALRMVGLIQLLAQIGSFVPASRARLPICDRIFTRVGASDNLVRGQSTFLVEMEEASAILAAATKRSLVLMDEIGRGTATYDGLSIAWAITEHLHEKIGAKTVFATHYHELTALETELAGVLNLHMAVQESAEEIIFLHRLRPGVADRSYGVEVGRLAGLPASVIARARRLLEELETGGHAVRHKVPDAQVELPLGPSDPTREAERLLGEQMRALDPNRMTPLEALTQLAALRESYVRQIEGKG